MKKIIAILLTAGVSLWATVNFPYPQSHAYANGIIANVTNACAGTDASSLLKEQFLTYLSGYYEESGDVARIKFDDNSYTVSEGIAYGMIFMVYFSDNTTSYQSQFDKLWKYYQSHLDGNGLMNWKIQGFTSNVAGSGGATDADEDAAFALAMAYYQFGNESYKTAASSLIAKIRQYEFASDGMHYPGDQWTSPKNPSYVSPAAYEIFKIFDSSNSSFWATAISKNYTLLAANQNATTGLPSGWSNESGSAQANSTYSFTGFDYDATRAPWRWAWAYAWYGHSQASSLLAKLGTWVNGKIVTQLKINMYQDGTTPSSCDNIGGCAANGSSIGSLSSSLIYNANFQSRLNTNYQSLMMQQSGYYHSSLRLLTGLLMSGNMQNLSTATAVTPSSSSSSVPDSCIASSSSAYVNSGAYGWESESAELSGETETGVLLGTVMNSSSRRWVTKELGGVTAGNTYTLSLTACEASDGESNTLNVFVNDGSLCTFSQDIEPGGCVDASCSYTPTANATDTLNVWVWDWTGDITISNLKYYSSNGDTLVSIAAGSARKSVPVFALFGKELNLNAPSSGSVTLMDMQGRVLTRLQVGAGQNAIDLSRLGKGNFVIRFRSAGASYTYQVRIP